MTTGPENPKPTTVKKARQPVFTKKEVATYAQCVEVLDWYYTNGKSQTKTANHFSTIYPNLKLKQPLVLKWLHKEDKICQRYEQDCTAWLLQHSNEYTKPSTQRLPR